MLWLLLYGNSRKLTESVLCWIISYKWRWGHVTNFYKNIHIHIFFLSGKATICYNEKWVRWMRLYMYSQSVSLLFNFTENPLSLSLSLSLSHTHTHTHTIFQGEQLPWNWNEILLKRMLGFATFKVSSFSIFNVFLFPMNGLALFFFWASTSCNSATVKEAKAKPSAPLSCLPLFSVYFNFHKLQVDS